MLGWMLNSVGCWKCYCECGVKDKYAVDEDDADKNDAENKVLRIRYLPPYLTNKVHVKDQCQYRQMCYS
jgi:hypothetical protein